MAVSHWRAWFWGGGGAVSSPCDWVVVAVDRLPAGIREVRVQVGYPSSKSFILADILVVAAGASEAETASRVTEALREVERRNCARLEHLPQT